jgi:hypothetical protein
MGEQVAKPKDRVSSPKQQKKASSLKSVSASQSNIDNGMPTTKFVALMIWMFLGIPFLYAIFPEPRFYPEKTTQFVVGTICTVQDDFYLPASSGSPGKQSNSCKEVALQEAGIGKKVYPPDFETYPERQAEKSAAYMRLQNGAASAAGGDYRLKEAAARQAYNDTLRRAEIEWGDKQKLPVLSEVYFPGRPSERWFANHTLEKVDAEHYSISGLQQFFIVTFLWILGIVAGFWFMLIPGTRNQRLPHP